MVVLIFVLLRRTFIVGSPTAKQDICHQTIINGVVVSQTVGPGRSQKFRLDPFPLHSFVLREEYFNVLCVVGVRRDKFERHEDPQTTRLVAFLIRMACVSPHSLLAANCSSCVSPYARHVYGPDFTSETLDPFGPCPFFLPLKCDKKAEKEGHSQTTNQCRRLCTCFNVYLEVRREDFIMRQKNRQGHHLCGALAGLSAGSAAVASGF